MHGVAPQKIHEAVSRLDRQPGHAVGRGGGGEGGRGACAEQLKLEAKFAGMRPVVVPLKQGEEGGTGLGYEPQEIGSDADVPIGMKHTNALGMAALQAEGQLERAISGMVFTDQQLEGFLQVLLKHAHHSLLEVVLMIARHHQHADAWGWRQPLRIGPFKGRNLAHLGTGDPASSGPIPGGSV